jgi:hypothetical protein
VTSGVPVRRAVILIRSLLSRHLYITTSEAQLQAQVVRALSPTSVPPGCRLSVATERRVRGGRLDVVVSYTTPLGTTVDVALELKMGGSVAAVERQVAKYAAGGAHPDPVADAIGVVTTSPVLAHRLVGGRVWTGASSRMSVICGMPYFVVQLRCF